MNRRLAWVVIAMISALALSGMAGSVYLVEISDIRQRDAWEVMTREELAKLRKDIQEEARVFPAALAAAKSAWEANDLYKKIRFPGAHIAPRKITQRGPFTNREIANKKKLVREERQHERMATEAKENRKKSVEERSAEALRRRNIDKAVEKVNAKLTEMLKRDVPLNF